MRKSYDYEIILYYFQIVLRNRLDPDLDPGFSGSGSGLRFLAGFVIRIQLNTHPKNCIHYMLNYLDGFEFDRKENQIWIPSLKEMDPNPNHILIILMYSLGNAIFYYLLPNRYNTL